MLLAAIEFAKWIERKQTTARRLVFVRRRETADFHRPRHAEGRTHHHFGRGNKQR